MDSQAPTSPICHADTGEMIAVPWGYISISASAKVGNAAFLTFGRSTILAGHHNPRHRHPNCEEVLHVLSGRVEHTLGDERFLLEPGDTISIPEGAWHQAFAIGTEDAEVVICFSSAARLTEMDGLG